MMTAIAKSCGPMHRASGEEHWAAVAAAVAVGVAIAAVAANHECEYLPRYVAYKGYMAGTSCWVPDCFPK